MRKSSAPAFEENFSLCIIMPPLLVLFYHAGSWAHHGLLALTQGEWKIICTIW